MKKYKYISIKQIDNEMHCKKPMYSIVNNKSENVLGKLFYYPAWRQYCFTQYSQNCVFNNSCLRDILDFMENET